jgi:transcriptional regulator with XRE-family HTH domain
VLIPRLKEWRERRALSQLDLAEASGVSRATIINLEKGNEAFPSTVRKLAHALRVDPGDLQRATPPTASEPS